ncbi:hypothetical protein E2C01_015734 [Portunus trituberculatus]|uniref:Uncharacterized protein n=1 Tax=Portunus trituberculatus TaxID=210409 RepID=A0A5B7DNV5_PORTR|nr:hypothetical protein [Portunus trituberculatus]
MMKTHPNTTRRASTAPSKRHVNSRDLQTGGTPSWVCSGTGTISGSVCCIVFISAIVLVSLEVCTKGISGLETLESWENTCWRGEGCYLTEPVGFSFIPRGRWSGDVLPLLSLSCDWPQDESRVLGSLTPARDRRMRS